MKRWLATPLLLAAAHAQPALTIYNQGFAVVRDSVPLKLEQGISAATFSGMTSQLEPDSVILRDPAGKAQFQILEQSYRNDPVSTPLLLSFFEGQTIDFFVKEPNKPDGVVRGKIVRSGFAPGGGATEPIIEVDGKIRFGLPGQPVFPTLGDGTILNPTLSWTIQSPAAAAFDAELAYVTGGFSWQAAYNLALPEKGETADLVGWVTVDNKSGRTFNKALIKLMAGDVQKIQPPRAMAKRMMAFAAAGEDADGAVVTEKTFDDFHLYTLARPATLRDQETKQVEFVRATGLKTERFYVYEGALIPGWQTGMTMGHDPGYGTQTNKKVATFVEFKNAEENRLGMPLPKGRLRLYRQDSDRRLEFVGEDSIDHTPRNETVRIRTGHAFDLVGERRQTDFKLRTAEHTASESFEIKVRNRKKEPAEIRVVERLYRYLQWEIRNPSQPFDKKDAQTVEFRVQLKPDEEKTVTYTAHYTW
jgi:hypothetical protein